jgi:hypothetical protein
MRIFISSVRDGLEVERDSLAALITALGHTPVRFEDFGPQDVPSRKACLDAVATCDVYLLLLGPRYGYRFPETGQSATHDEFIAAQQAGLRRLVFRKQGVAFEPEQEAFAKLVGDYGTGVFYGTFNEPTDLLAKAAAAIRGLAEQPGPIRYHRLSAAPAISWAADWAPRYGSASEATLEVHVIPIDQEPLPGREMLRVRDGLAASLRRIGVVPATAALDVKDGDGYVMATLPATRRQFNQPVDAELRQVRVAADGQVSVVTSLPRGSMAAIFDQANAGVLVARSLRLVGALQLVNSDMVAIAVGLEPTVMLAVGKLEDLRQTNSISLNTSDKPVRILPDEAVSREAMDSGAETVAETLVRLLERQLSSSRGR